MKRPIFQGIAIASMALTSAQLMADDELVVYVLKDGAAYEGATVILDNQQTSIIDRSGMVEFDLSAGGHSIQILDGETSVHAFRLDSASGQLVDVTAILDDGSSPRIGIENYFVNESAIDRSDAPEGGVRGLVLLDGSPASDAEVELGEQRVTTDSEGYFLVSAPRGVYDLVVTQGSSAEIVDDVRIVSNAVKQISEIRLAGTSRPSMADMGIHIQAPSIEEVFVVATFNPDMFGESEQFSSGVVNTMGAEELARFGGSDIAASVGRMPSITVQDDKYLFIRGLGGRYITTTLNASTMPSTDPSKRTVPLDLFPTNMVDQLDIKKTFLAYMPGETTGGNLEINTRAFPDQLTRKFSISLGGNGDITGEKVFSDSHSGAFDTFGFDDGTRKEPAITSAVATLYREFDDLRGDGSITHELSAVTAINLNRYATLDLIEDIDLTSKTAGPDVSMGFSIGGARYINDYEVGIFSAVNYSNTWGIQLDGIQRSYSGGGVSDDYATSRSTNNIELSGLVSLGLNMDSGSYEAVTMLSRTTEDEVSTREGFDGDALANTSGYTIFWEERQFISQQVRGEHIFGDLSADWQVTGSQAWRYAPDRREVRFDEEVEGEPYVLSFADITRNWEELTDTNMDVSVDFGYDFDFDTSIDWTSTADFGARVVARARDTESATYGFQASQQAIDDSAPNRQFSDVINESTVTGDRETGFSFSDETLPSDEYQAEMDLNAVYVSWENNFQGQYEFITGIRYEDYHQTTDTFELTGAEAAVQSVLDETSVLPSFSFNWYYSPEQQLRMAVTKTVSRPDFKETSNAVFYDDEFSDVRIRGNPYLDVSDIVNYDLRWEMYGEGEEKLSLALFYKDIDKAIERVALSASGTAGNSRTFENADSAYVAGIEVDLRKDFSFNSSLTKSMFVASNASYIESESEVANQPDRKLQGQPEYTFNLILGFDDLDNDQELTLIMNQNGASIRDVGVQGLADIIEEPRMDVSLSYNKRFGEKFGVKAKISNLLNQDIEYTQEGQVFRSYAKGTSLSLGFDLEF